ncbi:MAG: GNAT family N-acetyltransferase [Thiobacillaceae bacterium]
MSLPENPPIRVIEADWARHGPRINAIRRRVFIEEQGVPEALEWEARDAECDWFLAWAGDTPVGIARLTADAHIGRMAVLPEWRGRGVGRALLKAALERARARGLPAVHLHAQTHALGFYAREGFQAEGEVFLEAGIPHRRMTLHLTREAR